MKHFGNVPVFAAPCPVTEREEMRQMSFDQGRLDSSILPALLFSSVNYLSGNLNYNRQELCAQPQWCEDCLPE